jgi:hypothetical protein
LTAAGFFVGLKMNLLYNAEAYNTVKECDATADDSCNAFKTKIKRHN